MVEYPPRSLGSPGPRFDSQLERLRFFPILPKLLFQFPFPFLHFLPLPFPSSSFPFPFPSPYDLLFAIKNASFAFIPLTTIIIAWAEDAKVTTCDLTSVSVQNTNTERPFPRAIFNHVPFPSRIFFQINSNRFNGATGAKCRQNSKTTLCPTLPNPLYLPAKSCRTHLQNQFLDFTDTLVILLLKVSRPRPWNF